MGYYTSIKSSRKHSERVDQKLRETSKVLNWEGQKFPVNLQTSEHDHVRHVCFRCLNTFNSKESLASHHKYCKSI